MYTCQNCHIDITEYKKVGSLELFDDLDDERLVKDEKLHLKYGSQFFPMALLICPQCHEIHFFTLTSPILNNMKRLYNYK